MLINSADSAEEYLWRLFVFRLFKRLKRKQRHDILLDMLADLESNVVPLASPHPSREVQAKALALFKERLPRMLGE